MSPKKTEANKDSKDTTKDSKEPVVRRKVYVTFPEAKTREAIICDMYDLYKVRFNIRSASVSENLGLIALELEATLSTMEKAFAYFRKRGVKVEPIEITVLE